MIDVKEAARIAIHYFQDLYGDKYPIVTLEEIELLEDEPFWLITLGYAKSELYDLKYKELKIHNQSGEVISMKIRTVA